MKAKNIADALMRAGFGADERARDAMESIIAEALAGERKPVPKKAIALRKAWRELRGPASPAAWLSNDTLETADNIPLLKGVTVAETRRAVRLANAAPALLTACNKLLRCYDYGANTTSAELSAAAFAAREGIMDAKGGAK